MNETPSILWAMLQSHEVMEEFSKHKIKQHPSITSIFFRFLITTNIYEPLQDIYQMKRDIKVLRTKSNLYHGRLTNIEKWGEPRWWVLVDPSKLARPSVNLVIRLLLLDRDSSLKTGVVVSEDWPTWAIFLPSLGYQLLKIHDLEMFRKVYKVPAGRYSKWSWVVTSWSSGEAYQLTKSPFCCVSQSKFSRQLWGGGINIDSTEALMSIGYRIINFKKIHGSWRLVNHHRVGWMATAEYWVGLGASFGNLSTEDILSCGVPRTLNKIWDTLYKLSTGGASPSQEPSAKSGKKYKESMCVHRRIYPSKDQLCLI